MNSQNISLDLSKRTDYQQIVLAQGDFEGTTIIATIYDNGTKLAETGITAYFVMELPDGEHYVRDDATYSNGVITYVVDETHVAAVHGFTDNAYFELHKGNQIASTERFAVIIEQCAYDDAEPGEVYDNAITAAIGRLDDAIAGLDDVVEDVLEDHPEWTTTVQDNAITIPKLHASVRSSYGNAIIGSITGTVPQAADAFAAPPHGLAIFGRSTQSGTPTPSSPIEIVSLDEAEMRIAALNLLDASAVSDVSGRGLTLAKGSDGWFSLSGTSTATSAYVMAMWGSSGVELLPAGTYSVLLETEGTPFVTDKVRIQVYGGGSVYLDTAGSQTITVDAPINRVNVHVSSSSSGTSVDGRFRITMVRGGVAPSAYSQGKSSTVSVDLQGRVLHGLPDGTADSVEVDASGKVTLIRRVGVLDMGDVYWSSSSTDSADAKRMRSISIASQIRPYGGTGALPIICEAYPAVNASDTYHRVTGIDIDGSGYIHVYDPDYNTSSSYNAFRTAVTGVTLLYPLANPTVEAIGYVTLPDLPEPIFTAWAVHGAEVEVDYQRDANLVIDGLYAQLAPIDGPKAATNHAVGSYLMLGGTFCKVTSAIATGETIAIGTNVAATTVAAELLLKANA